MPVRVHRQMARRTVSAGGQRWGHNRPKAVVQHRPPRRQAVFKGLETQRLVALFAAGWALLSFPMLALWDHDVLVLGLPLLPLMLFVVWLVLILAVAWVLERPLD